MSVPGNISLKKSGKLKIIDPTTDKLIQASFSKYDEVIDTLRKILDFIETLEVQMQNLYESVKIKHKKHFFIDREKCSGVKYIWTSPRFSVSGVIFIQFISLFHQNQINYIKKINHKERHILLKSKLD